MNVQDAAEGVQRAASAAQNGGAAMSVGMGASIPVTQYLGWSVAEWQIFGILFGCGIGVAGLILNWGTNVYFKRLELAIRRQEAAK